MAHADCSREVRSYLNTRYSAIHEGNKVKTTISVRNIAVSDPDHIDDGAKLFYNVSYTVRTYRQNMGLPEEWFSSTKDENYIRFDDS